MLRTKNVQEQTGNGLAPRRAGETVRGAMRLLIAEGFSPLCEFTLGNKRRLDVAALAADGSFAGVEAKTCATDYRADTKWPDYVAYCDYFYFAVPPDFPQTILPAHTGLIVADRYGGAIVRQAPRAALHASRRRALTLAFARAAAERLARLQVPDGY
jgi:hypothetical protein